MTMDPALSLAARRVNAWHLSRWQSKDALPALPEDTLGALCAAEETDSDGAASDANELDAELG